MCFLSVGMFVWRDQVAGSVWGWFVLMGSEQNTDRESRSLLLLSLSAWQSRGGAGLWHIGCLRCDRTRSRDCCAAQSSCLSPGTGAGAGWDGGTAEHLWVEEIRRATSNVSATSQDYRFHGIILGPAQTLFSCEPGWDLTHYPFESPWDLTSL